MYEFDGVVRLTKVGLTYILATVVLAIAAVNTGNNSLYIAVSLMLGGLLFSGMASKGGLKHLSVEIADVDEAWAERPTEGTLRIRNRSRIWNVRDVVLYSESLATPVLLPLIPRRSTLEVPASFLFRRRGLAHVGAIDAYTRYPFGFVLKKRRLRVDSEVVVFPALLDRAPARDLFQPVAGEQMASGRPGGGSELHAFREYVTGDSLRHVHWKKSASLGRWIIKQTESDAAKAVQVVVDPYRPRGTSDEDFERMISEAATFLWHAARKGLDVTLLMPRLSVRARSSQPAAPLFRALAMLEPSAEAVWQPLERHSILFSVPGGRDDAKSA
jgi:uncharacterized protein (DUF58 family)